MGNIINRITEEMAAVSSRRRFFAKMGKVVAGLAAVVAGGVVTNDDALAKVFLACCSGSGCPTDSCPTGTYINYTWSCYYVPAGHNVTCVDCYVSSGTHNGYVCTYVTA